MMAQARRLLSFSCEVYAAQHASGRIFLHEHPATAESWQEDCIKKVLDLPGVVRRDLDMCQYNLRATDEQGEGLVKKATAIMTNSEVMGNCLARKCCGGHRHVLLKGGSKCARAAVYTNDFAEGIVESYKMHLRKTGQIKRKSKKTYSRKQRGSLEARNHIDAPIDELGTFEDDPEDNPTMGEVCEVIARLSESTGSEHSAHMIPPEQANMPQPR